MKNVSGEGLPRRSDDFPFTQMTSGDHALMEHGEDHELLLMDDVIDDMTGVRKARYSRTHIWPNLAERWGFCKQPHRPTKFVQAPLRLNCAPLAYGESTNAEQIRLGIRC